MSDDLDLDLEGAFRAVKDTYDGASPDADLTLQRALFASRRNTSRRKVAQWVVIPIAAALFASTAWAGVTGRLAPVVDSVREVFHAEAAPAEAPAIATSAGAPAKAKDGAEANAAEPASAVVDSTNTADALANADATRAGGGNNATADAARTSNGAPTGAPRANDMGSATLPVGPRGSFSATVPLAPIKSSGTGTGTDESATITAAASKSEAPAAPSAAPLTDGREALLFAEANRIHFNEHDPARALVAWDRYLAYAPNGSFAPEARYNRALTLIRLDHTTEARAELETFATGSYRRTEARALLDALARDAGP